MPETIFARISRLMSATVEESIDRLERAGGEAVMREAIREADRAVNQVKAERERVMARRLQAARQHTMLAKRIDELNGKARFAIGEGRDELAEAVLSRQIDFEVQAEKLGELQEQAREEEARLDQDLAALKARKTQMEDALSNFTLAQRDGSTDNASLSRLGSSPEKQVDAAEAAFNRAITGAGGLASAKADADTINRVAEVDALQKSAAIAARLAALKQQQQVSR